MLPEPACQALRKVDPVVLPRRVGRLDLRTTMLGRSGGEVPWSCGVTAENVPAQPTTMTVTTVQRETC